MIAIQFEIGKLPGRAGHLANGGASGKDAPKAFASQVALAVGRGAQGKSAAASGAFGCGATRLDADRAIADVVEVEKRLDGGVFVSAARGGVVDGAWIDSGSLRGKGGGLPDGWGLVWIVGRWGLVRIGGGLGGGDLRGLLLRRRRGLLAWAIATGCCGRKEHGAGKKYPFHGRFGTPRLCVDRVGRREATGKVM